jgi:HprK-related kinase A
LNLGDLTSAGLRQQLRGAGVVLVTGPFVFRLTSPFESVAEGLALLYDQYELGPTDGFADFAVHIGHGAGLRRWIKPQSRFLFDGQPVFEPLPEAHAYPLLEWAMNWCISTHAHQFLIIHAAVIERGGQAVVLPAPPGSGKSTLCAGLVLRGWRLLSDELALVSMADGQVWPLCRPVSLKNTSIDVIRQFEPTTVFNRITHDTTKGSVTHMQVPRPHLAAIGKTATVRWVVFPRYVPGAPALMAPRSRAASLVELARNSFNFGVLGEAGFDRLGDLVSGSGCFDFSYSQLDDAVGSFEQLAFPS